MKTAAKVLFALGISLAGVASADAQTNFTKITTSNLVTEKGSYIYGTWGDFNEGSFLDLFAANDEGSNAFYLYNAKGTFTEMNQGPIEADSFADYACWAANWVDYDNDGFLDLFVARSADSGSLTSNFLYHNTGTTNGWLEVKLTGTVANRSTPSVSIVP